MNESILIIDDEPGIIDAAAWPLERDGYTVHRAYRGREGLDILEKTPIDCIILDIGLPDMSGLDMIREIRKSSTVPVIFLTARAEEVDRIVGLELGADDYLGKPFSPRELAARVKAILRRAAAAAAAVQNPSPAFAIDENRRLIHYHGTRLDCSRYEYELLLLLVRRPGWVFSRDQIMELIWTDPGESFDRTVDTHIKTIRAKLRAVREEPDPIVTHRGIGYSLRDDL